ncbi:HEAT repeat domain-containing protein [Streptomyces sp. NPDC006208]|uniref:HEAT repeat domain-containing protein n=1 Tax=Streptomyces sp. NPDC006208 TaxID=3156734 RepID=UPI0033A4F0BB
MDAGTTWDARAGQEAALHLLRGARASDVLDWTNPAAWTALDQGVRSVSWHRRDLAARIRARPETALCHPDGRIREAALAEKPDTPALLPLVVIRCADWAEPVRRRARRMLAEALESAPEHTLCLLTPLVLRVGRREQGTWARELFVETLRTSPYPALPRLRDSTDTATRRLAARITVDHGLLGAPELARRAVDDLDPVLWRLWSDAALAAMAADAVDDEAVDILLGARAPLVRSAGVTALRRAGRAREAVAHLTDRAALVRACARWVVHQNGGDPRPQYVELCTDPATVEPFAVSGLAECGHREDAALLRPLLTHPVAGVRAQAVGGLRQLDSTPVEALRPLLDDPSAAVAREVTWALLPHARRLPANWLGDRLSAWRPTHTRRAAFRLLKAQGGLSELSAAVALLADTDPRLRRCAESAVQQRRWLDEVPRGDAAVDGLLRQCTHLFSDYVMSGMRSRVGLSA